MWRKRKEKTLGYEWREKDRELRGDGKKRIAVKRVQERDGEGIKKQRKQGERRRDEKRG